MDCWSFCKHWDIYFLRFAIIPSQRWSQEPWWTNHGYVSSVYCGYALNGYPTYPTQLLWTFEWWIGCSTTLKPRDLQVVERAKMINLNSSQKTSRFRREEESRLKDNKLHFVERACHDLLVCDWSRCCLFICNSWVNLWTMHGNNCCIPQ
jgi:hypothetical protein